MSIQKESECLNCGYLLKDDRKYCPNCGQENKSLKIDFRQLFSEFFETYFGLDSKFFKSLLPLLFKPGFLTKQFLSGKRARYIPPVRLYFVVSILYFFILSIDNLAGIEESISDDESNFTLMLPNDTLVYDSSDDFIKDIEKQGFKEYHDSVGADSPIAKFGLTQIYKIAKNKGKGLKEQYLNNVSIMMFFLLPFFALLLKLFFKKQKYFYNEHLMFSYHLHAFIFLFLSLYILFSKYILHYFSISILILIITIYTFLALGKVYRYSVKSTIGRFLLLMFVYNIILFFGLVLSLFVSIVLY